MQVGEVIRKYRKSKNMTQEEMARRLGVTAPAVNKWEHGNSLPDITLLMPIARLLGISTDELLSYQQELTAEEIGEILKKQLQCWRKCHIRMHLHGQRKNSNSTQTASR